MVNNFSIRLLTSKKTYLFRINYLLVSNKLWRSLLKTVSKFIRNVMSAFEETVINFMQQKRLQTS